MSTMGGNASFLGNRRTALVIGGHDDTPNGMAPDGSSNMVIKDPTRQGPGVKVEHLPFSGRIRSPDLWSQCSTPGLLDPGKGVYMEGDLGGKPVITGLTEERYQPSNSATPSNSNMLNRIPDFSKAINHALSGVNLPPDIKKTVEKGAEIYKAVEKGSFAHNMLAGLPAHGAVAALLAIRAPSEKNIETAIQKFSKIMTSEILSKLPGQVMSMGKIFSDILSNSKTLQSVTKNMPPDIKDAFQSLGKLIQNVDTSEGSSLTSFRADPSTIAKNAISMFKNAKTVNDLMYITQELSSNTALHGLDKLKDITAPITSPFGNYNLNISPTGNITENVSNTITNAISAFTNSMSSPSSFQSATKGANFFSQSSGQMFDMLNQLPNSQLTAGVNLLKKLNTEGPELVFKKVREITNSAGGSPASVLAALKKATS